MSFKTIEIAKANAKLPVGVYDVLKELADLKGITISDVLNEAIAYYLSPDSNILGNELKNDFYERFITLLISLKNQEHYTFYLDNIRKLSEIRIDNERVYMNKIDEVRRLIDTLYPELGGVDKRRFLKLILFKEEIFDNLIKNIINDERVLPERDTERG